MKRREASRHRAPLVCERADTAQSKSEKIVDSADYHPELPRIASRRIARRVIAASWEEPVRIELETASDGGLRVVIVIRPPISLGARHDEAIRRNMSPRRF